MHKQKILDENEKQYGEEMRSKTNIYDPEIVKYSQNKVKNMSKEDFEKITALGEEIKNLLEDEVLKEDFNADIAKTIYEKHRDWLFFYWGKYSVESHRGICDMYIYDERFKKHYDKNVNGCAEYLKKCVYFCTDGEL